MLRVSDHCIKALSAIFTWFGSFYATTMTTLVATLIATLITTLIATLVSTLVATLMVTFTTIDFLGTLLLAFDWTRNITGVSTTHVWSIGTQMRIWAITISTGDMITIRRSGTSNVFDTFPDEGSEMSSSTTRS
jgi:hypothetical protein